MVWDCSRGAAGKNEAEERCGCFILHIETTMVGRALISSRYLCLGVMLLQRLDFETLPVWERVCVSSVRSYGLFNAKRGEKRQPHVPPLACEVIICSYLPI